MDYSWIKKWSALLAGIVGYQLVAQFINTLTGWIIVRYLSPSEYALFTITNSIQTMLGAISDLGLTGAFVYLGGEVWNKPAKLGSVYAAVDAKRRFLAILATVFVIPIGVFLLLKNGASLFSASILLISSLVYLIFSSLGSINTEVLKLQKHYTQIQKYGLHACIFRMLATSLVVIPNAAFAIVTTVAATGAQIFNAYRIKSVSSKYFVSGQELEAIHTIKVDEIVRTMLPAVIFHLLQGQIMILILGFMGKEIAVADLGALMRYGILFTIPGVIISQVVSPLIAKTISKKEIFSAIIKSIFAYVSYSILIIAITCLFSSEILWILGSNYADLNQELILYMCNLASGGFASLIWTIISSKNWIKKNWVGIPITLCVQIFILLGMHLSDVKSALLFSIITNLSTLGWNLFMMIQNFRKIN